jgi:hypothetical protein
MITYVKVNEFGVPVRAGNGLILPDGFIEFPADIPVTELYDLMLIEGSWMPRPVVTPPDYPDGTVIDAYGPGRSFLGTFTTPCQLPAEAVFLDIVPPMPYAPLTLLIDTTG